MSMSAFLTREMLDHKLADISRRDGEPMALSLRPSCHPKAAVVVDYCGAGVIWLRCNKCLHHFARLKLAKQVTIS